MDYKKSYQLWMAAILFGGLGSILGATFNLDILLFPGLIILGAGYLQKLKFCICPHCNKKIDLTKGMPKTCPHCKNAL